MIMYDYVRQYRGSQYRRSDGYTARGQQNTTHLPITRMRNRDQYGKSIGQVAGLEFSE